MENTLPGAKLYIRLNATDTIDTTNAIDEIVVSIRHFLSLESPVSDGGFCCGEGVKDSFFVIAVWSDDGFFCACSVDFIKTHLRMFFCVGTCKLITDYTKLLQVYKAPYRKIFLPSSGKHLSFTKVDILTISVLPYNQSLTEPTKPGADCTTVRSRLFVCV